MTSVLTSLLTKLRSRVRRLRLSVLCVVFRSPSLRRRYVADVGRFWIADEQRALSAGEARRSGRTIDRKRSDVRRRQVADVVRIVASGGHLRQPELRRPIRLAADKDSVGVRNERSGSRSLQIRKGRRPREEKRRSVGR